MSRGRALRQRFHALWPDRRRDRAYVRAASNDRHLPDLFWFPICHFRLFRRGSLLPVLV